MPPAFGLREVPLSDVKATYTYVRSASGAGPSHLRADAIIDEDGGVCGWIESMALSPKKQEPER